MAPEPSTLSEKYEVCNSLTPFHLSKINNNKCSKTFHDLDKDTSQHMCAESEVLDTPYSLPSFLNLLPFKAYPGPEGSHNPWYCVWMNFEGGSSSEQAYACTVYVSICIGIYHLTAVSIFSGNHKSW